MKNSWRNRNKIYHGGCLLCCSQHIYGIKRCSGCCYKKANWNLPDLNIEGPPSKKVTIRQIRKEKLKEIEKNER